MGCSMIGFTKIISCTYGYGWKWWYTMDILGTIFSDNLIILVYKMYDGWISNQEYLAILYIYTYHQNSFY